MLENIQVKPAKDRRVRDPRTGHPFPDNVWTSVPATFYIHRRLRDGDLVRRGGAATETKKSRHVPVADVEE